MVLLIQSCLEVTEGILNVVSIMILFFFLPRRAYRVADNWDGEPDPQSAIGRGWGQTQQWEEEAIGHHAPGGTVHPTDGTPHGEDVFTKCRLTPRQTWFVLWFSNASLTTLKLLVRVLEIKMAVEGLLKPEIRKCNKSLNITKNFSPLNIIHNFSYEILCV